MKVYIMTKAVPFGKEEYVGVKKSRKDAMKSFKQWYPFMRETSNGISSDSKNTFLLFIHEEEV